MPMFCIQEHHAKRAGKHWDLRVEMPGDPDALGCYVAKRHFETSPEPRPVPEGPRSVLRSWVIPKARLPEPGERLLTIPVEDHPFEYLTFSGEIEEGYGAGRVDLVAHGECSCEGTRGLKLTLNGLGRFKLVPFRGKFLLMRLS